MTVSVSVSIDVPSLADGVAFYCAAFGFSKKSEPVPGVAVLQGLNVELCLLEKPAGSKPSMASVSSSAKANREARHFEKAWMIFQCG